MHIVDLPVLPAGETRTFRFHSETDPPPERIEIVGDATPAGHALRVARARTHLLYEGDERNAKQLLAALARRAIRRSRPKADATPADLFHRERAARIEEHRILSRLLVALCAKWRLELRHASDVARACEAAWGPWTVGPPVLVPLRELLGVVGAWEWQRRGIAIEALGGRIHPRWGVFAPTRPAYVELVASAPLPARCETVFDLGTGTGVLGLVLAKRGARRVIATDVDERAIACATDNARRLGLADRFHAELRDLWPKSVEHADLVVFNPPWVPSAPRSRIERAIFDPKGEVLERFLGGVAAHLEPGGEAWLALSDFAERLGMRAPDHVARRAEAHGLEIAWRLDAPARKDERARAAGRDEEAEPEAIRVARANERIEVYCLKPRA